MSELKKSIILILIVLVISGCAPKKEIEKIQQPKIIASMEQSPKEDEDNQKEQILKEVKRHIEKREYEKAISKLNKAIELDPEDASLYYTLGDLYEQVGKDKESVEAFVKALQFDPGRRKISKEKKEDRK